MSDEGVTVLLREEYVDNEPTGVELEQDEEQEEITRPWDPNRIRVTTKPFSLRNILDLIDERDLELAPDFQRNQVWKPGQKSRLIESILLQIPLPAFYFAEDKDGKMRVVDGLQRLSTVHSFVRGDGFKLTGLEYLEDANGQRFDELPAPWRRRIHNTQIVAHVVDPTTPVDVMYDIFKRINTGGTPLSAQEIRHCMSQPRSREFLKVCTQTEEFDRATGGRLRGHIRMNDREMVLRFCAFRLLGQQEYYDEYQAMDPFLYEATERLDDEKRVSDRRLDELSNAFRRAMINSYEVFGRYAFRKWPRGQDSLNPINRPLFEAWSVTLADYKLPDLQRRRDQIVRQARDLMTEDARYVEAISSSTGDPKKVAYRFEKTAEAAEAGR